jgi:hypothetical protein
VGEAVTGEGQAADWPAGPSAPEDRTGQCWSTHGATFLVLGPPDPWMDAYGHVGHPALWLDDPRDRWEPGKETSMGENAFKRWEDQPYMRRVL